MSARSPRSPSSHDYQGVGHVKSSSSRNCPRGRVQRPVRAIRARSTTSSRDSLVAEAVGRERKAKLSLVLYVAAIPLAFVSPWIAAGLYVLVALLWLIPDPRIERKLENRKE